MLKFSSILFALLLVAQVEIVHSVTGICFKCNEILNQAQCDGSYLPPYGCKWGTSCTTPSSATAVYSNAYPSDQSSSSKQPTCASKTDGCIGMDGSSMTMACYSEDYGSKTCQAIDNTKACNTYVTDNQCLIRPGCNWKATSSSAGSCVVNQCSDLLKEGCLISIVTNFQAQACVWTPSTNATKSTSSKAGSCANGLATDIPQDICSQGYQIYFTYNSATSKCTECTDTYHSSSGEIIQTILLMFLLACYAF